MHDFTHETNLTLIDNGDDYDVEWERINHQCPILNNSIVENNFFC